jgi:hypothetical protein
MEIVQALAAFFVVFAVSVALLQLVSAWALQVIAEKNELPDFTSFIAWIPLLNLYPYIKVGGGDFKKFFLGSIGLMLGLAVIAGGAAAGGFGGAGAGITAGVFVIAAIVYFARIAMGTAERRGLSRWIGLLLFVPPVSLFIYPYIAFHDGVRAPNKLGLVIGLLLAFGPLPGQIQMVNAISEQADQIAHSELGDGATLEQALGGFGAAMEIGTQLAVLDGMDPSNPGEAETMREQIEKTRNTLKASRETLGEEAATEMESVLQIYEQRLANPGAPATVQTAAVPAFAAPPRPAPAAPPLTAALRRQGDGGFAVPSDPECPPGTARRGAPPPAGKREWCERVGADAGIKHGWMTEYHASGAPAASGEYRDGLRVGVWTRYYEDGSKRVQAQFENGLQSGVLISWGPDGAKIYEQQFVDGTPVTPASR